MDKKRTRSIPDIYEDGPNGEKFLIRRKIIKSKIVDANNQIQEVEKINEIKYRIDAAFQPEHPEEISEEFMRNFIKEKGVAAVKWYLDLWDKGEKQDDGSYKKLTLREIINLFIANRDYGLNGSVELLKRKSKKDVVKEDLEAWLSKNERKRSDN